MAFADGQLDAARVARIERHLRDHPQDAERVARWREQNAALKAVLDPVLDEPAPARLRGTLEQARHGGGGWRMAAAAIVLLAAGTAAGWGLRGLAGPEAAPPMVAASPAGEALRAHAVYAVEVRHPVEVGADAEAHLVAWLSKRLGAKLSAPDLSDRGFRLIGGRLLPAASGAAAMFMYEDAAGRRVSIHAVRRHGDGRTAFRFIRRGKWRGFAWRDPDMAYAVIGDIDRPTLKALALKAHDALG